MILADKEKEGAEDGDANQDKDEESKAHVLDADQGTATEINPENAGLEESESALKDREHDIDSKEQLKKRRQETVSFQTEPKEVSFNDYRDINDERTRICYL